MLRVKARRASDLKNWVQGGSVQEHRERWMGTSLRGKSESLVVNVQFPHRESSGGDARCPAQRSGLDQG